MEYGRETVVLVEIDQPFCSRIYGDGAQTLTVDGATFDGSNDYMTRGAGLTGAADSKTGIFSGWFRLDGGDGSQLNVFQAVATLGGLDSRVAITRTTANQFDFSLADSGGTVRLGIGTLATYVSGASWLHLLASWDLNTAGARSIYVNDGLDVQQFTFSNATLDYTVADWVWGARGNGTNKWNGGMAELYFAPGQYLDFAVEANRRKFISAVGKPVFLGSDGSIPTGTAPLVYQHLDDAEAVANFATNRATGGNFSITGTLATATSSPSDNPGCQAVLGTTGTRKCFNTRFTCQDPANYDGDGTADPALVLPGNIGNYASLPGSVDNTVTGDLDVRLNIAPADWTPAARAALAAKISADTLALGWMVSIETDGTLRLWWSPDGVNLPFVASTVAPSDVTDGVATWVRATLDVDDGAGNNVVTFATSLDGETWTLVGTPVTTAGATSIFNNPSVGITLGIYLPLPGSYRWAGHVYTAEVRNGIGGALVAKFDPPIDAMLANADSFTSTGTSDIWTIHKSGYPQAAFVVKRLSMRFGYPQDGLLQYGPVTPSLQELSTAPASVNLAGMDRSAGPMGVRESVTVVHDDHLHSDDLVDKYRLERLSGAAQTDGIGYDPYTRGTFWGKWLARNPYYPAYALRVYEGFLGDAIADMRVRHYVIDSIDGPTDGQVSVTAKDLFTAIEARKSVAPLPSNGALSADISAVAGSATLTPAGIGDLEYPASGNVAIEEECITFTRAGDVLTLTARGALNTVAAAHKQEDLVQLVLSYSAQLAVDIAYDLLLSYTSLTTANLPKAQWDIAAAALTELYTARIATPTPVEDLLGELCEQAGFTLVPDISVNQIRFAPLRASTPATTVDEDGWIAEDSLSLKHQTENRVSQVWVYYAQINPTKSLDEKTNFRSRVVDADLGAEGGQQYGSPAIKEIFSRWIPQFGRGVAIDTGLRSLAMFRDPPLEAEFRLDVVRDGELQPAQFFNLQINDVQDDTGDALPVVMVPTQIERGENQIKVIAQQVRFYAADLPSGDRIIYIENDCFDLNLRTVYESLYAAPLGTETVRFIVISGVTVGATSTSIPAVRTGTWPAGCTLNLDVTLGRIEGCGGRGGAGGAGTAGAPGGAGGTAILAEFAIEIDDSTGQVWAGGGGGGGGGGGNDATGHHDAGGGGGGGAGNKGGAGGPNAASTVHPGKVSTPGTAGTDVTGGTGGAGYWPATSGRGGNGGGPGSAGSAGTGDTGHIPVLPGGAGGAAGKYAEGNAFITWIGTGDRRGGVS